MTDWERLAAGLDTMRAERAVRLLAGQSPCDHGVWAHEWRCVQCGEYLDLMTSFIGKLQFSTCEHGFWLHEPFSCGARPCIVRFLARGFVVELAARLWPSR